MQCVSNRCKELFKRKKYFGVIGTLSFFGCDVQQERNWEFMMYIPCYNGNGKIAR